MTSSNSTSSATQQQRKGAIISRGWMVTINNPVIPGDAYLAQWLHDGNIVFGCGQLEKAPETGTRHLQMYIVTKPNPTNKNGFSQKWMKENIHSTAHLDKRQGTHEEARDYCTLPEYKGKKKEVLAGPWTVGEWAGHHELTTEEKKKGGEVNKNKILAIKRKIDDGARDQELYQEHFPEMLRYSKGFERYRTTMLDKSRTWQTKAMVLYGPAGTGKTMRAWHVAKNIFGEDVYPLQLEGETVWWDGYSGQKCIIIDEFYGQMKINYLLKLLDRYPLLVQTKGGMTPFLAEMIVFTSNVHPHEWYGKVIDDLDPLKRTTSKIPQNVLDALKRRLSGKCGTIKEMKDLVPIEDDDSEDFAEEWKKLEQIADELSAPTPTTTPAPIDLTCDEELAQSDDDWEDHQETGYVDYNPEEDYEHGFQEDYVEDFDERHPSQLVRRNAMTSVDAPAPKKLKSGQATSFGLLAPPKGATLSDWKAVKQVPGQTKLVIQSQHKVNDDDE